MRFGLDEDQSSLQAAVRQLFERHAPLDETRSAFNMSSHQGTWERMTDMGLQGLTLPDEIGGSDATLLELGVALQEAGRVLLPGPFLASAGLATSVLGAGDTRTTRAWTERLAAGQLIGTACMDATGVTVQGTGDRVVLSGGTGPVLSGDVADVLVLVSTHESEVRLVVVDLAAPGVESRVTTGVDPSRGFAEFTFDRAEASVLDSDPAAVDRALGAAALCVAAEQVGAAEAVLAMTVDYAQTRHQFGRPIGSFQAVKHRCADMFVDVERARSAVMAATHDLVAETGSAAEPYMAAGTASRSFGRVARSAIQVHGAIGFTWEHNAPRFLKRALSTAAVVAAFAPATRAVRSLETASVGDRKVVQEAVG